MGHEASITLDYSKADEQDLLRLSWILPFPSVAYSFLELVTTGPFNSWDRQPYITEVRDGSPNVDKAWDEIRGNFFIGERIYPPPSFPHHLSVRMILRETFR